MILASLIDTSPRLKMLRAQAQAKAEESDAVVRDWYRVRAADDDTTEIFIYDEISWFGVTASAFAEELRNITTRNIDLRLSSPGGDVFDGITIHNAIRSHPSRVTVQVDGIAASIASVIAMAGDEIVMGPHSQLMVHDARGLVYGDPADVKDFLDLLERQSDNISQVYRERAGGQAKSWRAKMRSETWYTAAEAVAAGLADKVAQYPRQAAPADEPKGVAAQAESRTWDLSVFRYPGRENAPDPRSVDLAAEDPPERTEVAAEAVARGAGLDPDLLRTEVERALLAATATPPTWFVEALAELRTSAHDGEGDDSTPVEDVPAPPGGGDSGGGTNDDQPESSVDAATDEPVTTESTDPGEAEDAAPPEDDWADSVSRLDEPIDDGWAASAARLEGAAL